MTILFLRLKCLSEVENMELLSLKFWREEPVFTITCILGVICYVEYGYIFGYGYYIYLVSR